MRANFGETRSVRRQCTETADARLEASYLERSRRAATFDLAEPLM